MAINKPDLTNWARDLVLKGLNNLAGSIETSDDPSPVQRLADHWRSMTDEEKDNIATRVAGAAGTVMASLPLVAGAKRTAKRAPRRPAKAKAAPAAEVAADVPKKKDKKSKEKKEKKKDKKSKKDKKKSKKK